jgi:hypothetical protein
MRKIAFVILSIGALGSTALVLNAGRYSPILLLILFVGWVISPFIVLFLISSFYKIRLKIATEMLYWIMLLISIGALASYSITLIQHRVKPPTGVYLSVPFLSWVIILIFIAVSFYRKPNKKIENF